MQHPIRVYGVHADCPARQAEVAVGPCGVVVLGRCLPLCKDLAMLVKVVAGAVEVYPPSIRSAE